jgi:methylenetetrahydrofolate dehydrogenase (NADP+)/methenyltetrahydrofolate cyclohydrolase
VTAGGPAGLEAADRANAAVTVALTGVADWPRYTRQADILIVTAGVPGIVQPEHVRPGAVVIGGGVRYAGRRLLPDVYGSCAAVASAVTPRVGGVGPTTVAMFFRNAADAAGRSPA